MSDSIKHEFSARPVPTSLIKESDARLERQRKRELSEIEKARAAGKNHSYIDDDGCEVTVTPGGHAFYNMADWY